MILLQLFHSTLGYAYVDPGTGAAFAGWFGAVLAAFGSILLIYFKSIIRFLKKNKMVSLISLMITVILATTILLFPHKKNIMTKQKVIALGIDGLDHSILTMLMQQGKVPHFLKLTSQGTFIPLKPEMPVQSPVVWSSMATGVTPTKHGIYDFIGRDPKTMQPELAINKRNTSPIKSQYYAPVIKHKTIWKKLTEKGVANSFIRWPLTFPATKITGKMLSGLGVPDINGLMGHYTLYTSSPAQDPRINNIKIVQKNSTIETQLLGPAKKAAFTEEVLSKKLTFDINGKSIDISIDDKNVANVAQHSWSDWIRTNFKIGILKEASVIFRFYLESIEPHFKLYLGALQVDPRNPIYTISTPQEYSKELANAIGDFHTLGIPEDTKALDEGALTDSAFLEQVEGIHEERTKMFWHQFNKFENGLFAFVFDSTDRIQHMFWRNNKMSPEYKVLELAPEIESYYLKMDRLLGKVLKRIDAQTSLIVFSDHGFTSYDYSVDINRFLIQKGWLTAKAKVTEILPLFSSIDWSKSKAYAVGFSSIFISTKNRETNGIISQDEKKPLIEKIQKELESLTHDGKRVIKRAYTPRELYQDEDPESPDLIIGFMPGFRMSKTSAIGGANEQVITPNQKKWSGDHIVDASFVPGIFLSNFSLQKSSIQAREMFQVLHDKVNPPN